MNARVRVKICCVSSIDEARMAIDAGADALGLVSAMPSGPGVIDDDAIARIATLAPPGVATFLLTSKTDPDAIAQQALASGVDTIQLVDSLAPGAHVRLRALIPRSLKLVQVIHVFGSESVDEAQRIAPFVDALLLDSGNPNLAVKELGGTGRKHDWRVSRAVRESVAVPVYLAGGLTPENVAEAIETVNPFGLDICSGVRTDNRLDPEKLARFFFQASRAANN